MAWTDDKTVFVTWLNRAQNLSYVTLCQISDGSCQIVSGHGGLKAKEYSPRFAHGQIFSDRCNEHLMKLRSNVGSSGLVDWVVCQSAGDLVGCVVHWCSVSWLAGRYMMVFRSVGVFYAPVSVVNDCCWKHCILLALDVCIKWLVTCGLVAHCLLAQVVSIVCVVGDVDKNWVSQCRFELLLAELSCTSDTNHHSKTKQG